MIRKLVVLAALLLPTLALAQNTTLIKGQKPDGTTNTAAAQDANGKLMVNPTTVRVEGTSLNFTTIPISTNLASVVKTNLPFYVQDVRDLTVLVSWAAADSDSVALEVFVVGKVSGNAADGEDYLIDMNPATKRLDGVLVGNNRHIFNQMMLHAGLDSTGLVWAPASTLPAYAAGATLGPPSVAPFYGAVYSSASQFAICPRGTEPPLFQYFSLWVCNLSLTRVATGVTVRCLVRGS